MFPAQLLEAAIRDEIAAAINDRPTPLGTWESEIDSLVMVRVICRIEEEIAVELPDDLMPQGGFDGADHYVAIVMKACREQWNANLPVKEEA